MDTVITVKALKYGDRPHYEWTTNVLELTDSYVFVLSEKGRKLLHHTKQSVFTVDNWTIEFFSFDSWFTVSADVIGGEIQQYYCNINEPARKSGNVVTFVDLDLDLVYRDGEWKVVDEDEFAGNAIKYGYPEETIWRARQELKNLQDRIANKKFPFDGTLEKFVTRVPAN